MTQTQPIDPNGQGVGLDEVLSVLDEIASRASDVAKPGMRLVLNAHCVQARDLAARLRAAGLQPAIPAEASPNTLGHSPNGRFVVTITEVRS
ncbi:hypothetical protein [Aureimonas leprariae]|uniref:hypothetical protein n=1 Tax=Plantimonas leprariae TaxID=2615207 RepID=UPI00192A2F39|nr:hypothetical protein [Aureimonas leprariae]